MEIEIYIVAVYNMEGKYVKGFRIYVFSDKEEALELVESENEVENTVASLIEDGVEYRIEGRVAEKEDRPLIREGETRDILNGNLRIITFLNRNNMSSTIPVDFEMDLQRRLFSEKLDYHLDWNRLMGVVRAILSKEIRDLKRDEIYRPLTEGDIMGTFNAVVEYLKNNKI